MKHKATHRNVAERDVTDRDAPQQHTINGAIYVVATALATELGISRQTLWRWRSEERIPAGHVYRKQLVFSEDEASLVRQYTDRLEPALPAGARQLRLFKGGEK